MPFGHISGGDAFGLQVAAWHHCTSSLSVQPALTNAFPFCPQHSKHSSALFARALLQKSINSMVHFEGGGGGDGGGGGGDGGGEGEGGMPAGALIAAAAA